jgi:hypothetical protein
LFHAEGRTDTINLTATFCRFAKAPKTIGPENIVTKHFLSTVITPEMGLLFLKLKFDSKK